MNVEIDEKKIAIAGEKLKDWHWRINNLYYITNKNGKEIRFRMNRPQAHFFKNMWYRNLILKARQLGFTTFTLIFMLDACLFRPNTRCALIAHTKDDAKRLFREKVKFAYDRLPDELKQEVSAKNDSAGELVFSNGSSITVGTSFRGGTLRYLHVSEFGKICKKYPDKAKEIVTGAFEAVGKDCVITIESTAEGRTGYFYEYCQTAEQQMLAEAKLTQLDWKFFFFKWDEDPEYQLDDDVEIPYRLIEYFGELEKNHSINLSYPQKVWYAKKEATLGADMKREYPSTPGEAFEQSIEGAYYASQFTKIWQEKRICSVPYEPGTAVHTIWDLGVNDTNSIWFVQRCGREWHIIDYYANSGEGLGHYIAVLDEKRRELGYHYGTHVGPHDLEVREWGNDGKSRRETARAKGINFEVAPNLSVSDGIDAVRDILALCWFDESRTEEGYNALQAYRKEWDDKHGVWKNKPLHDENSHPADSFRYFALSIQMLIENYSRAPVARAQQAAPSAGWT